MDFTPSQVVKIEERIHKILYAYYIFSNFLNTYMKVDEESWDDSDSEMPEDI